MSRKCAEKVKKTKQSYTKTKRETFDIRTMGNFVATLASLRPLEASEEITKREAIDKETIGDFVATFASLRPLEDS